MQSYITQQSIFLQDPSKTSRLEERYRFPDSNLDPRWFFVDDEDGIARAMVDDHGELVGVVRLVGQFASIYLDFDGDRSVDFAHLSTPSEEIILIGEAARNSAEFDLFNPFCAVQSGSSDLSSFLEASSQITCDADSNGESEGGDSGGGSNPNTSPNGYADLSYMPPKLFASLCASYSGKQAGGLVSGNPTSGALKDIIKAGLKNAIGGAVRRTVTAVVRRVVFEILFDEGRGTGTAGDPTHTGAYPCEYRGNCGSPDATPEDYQVLPPGEQPEPEPEGGSPDSEPLPGEGNDGFEQMCENYRKSMKHWFDLSGNNTAVSTNCLDPVKKKSLTSNLKHIDCMNNSTGENDPVKAVQGILNQFKGGCNNPVAQPVPGGSCMTLSGLGNGKTGSVFFGYTDIVAATTGIEACPVEVCR